MAHLALSEFQALRIAVLTISDTRTLATDGSGQTLVDGLQEAGHILQGRALVPDDIWQIRARVCAWVADPLVQVVLLTGGTGFTAQDRRPRLSNRCSTRSWKVSANCSDRSRWKKSVPRPCSPAPWPG